MTFKNLEIDVVKRPEDAAAFIIFRSHRPDAMPATLLCKFERNSNVALLPTVFPLSTFISLVRETNVSAVCDCTVDDMPSWNFEHAQERFVHF